MLFILFWILFTVLCLITLFPDNQDSTFTAVFSISLALLSVLFAILFLLVEV